MFKIVFTLKSHLLALFASVALTLSAHGQGTVAFGNSALTRVTIEGVGNVPINFPVVYGFFWGTSLESMTLTLPLAPASGSFAGGISAPSVYSIPGTTPGEIGFAQVRGWSSEFGNDWERASRTWARSLAKRTFGRLHWDSVQDLES